MAGAKQVRRTGINTLAYMGVEPVSPTNFVTFDRDPTTLDYRNWNVGDEWENRTTKDVFKLVRVERIIGDTFSATWVKAVGGSGNITNLKDDSGTVILPDATGAVSIKGGDLINTVASANTVTINLNQGADGQIPIAATGGSTAFANLVAGANVAIVDGPNSITISSVGAGGNVTLAGDGGTTATSVAGTVNLIGTANRLTATGDMAQTMTLDVGSDVSTSFLTDDAASAVPAANVLTIAGANDLQTSSAGSTVTISRYQSGFSANINVENNVSGDGTVWSLGAQSAMTELYDLGGDFFPGDGAGTPASFTAPINGTYAFQFGLVMHHEVGGAAEFAFYLQVDGLGAYGGNSMPTRNRVPNFYGTNGYVGLNSSSIIYLTAGQVVTCVYFGNAGAKTDDIEGGTFAGSLIS